MSNRKPCPFCGSAKVYIIGHQGLYDICCVVCGARLVNRWTENEAIEAWNTRAETFLDAYADVVEETLRGEE